MRHILTLAAALLAFVAPIHASPYATPPLTLPPPPTGKVWASAFSDKFAANALDLSAWTITTGTHGSEPQGYSNAAQNVSVSPSGFLYLTATATPYAVSWGTLAYSSGEVRTRQSWTYGCFAICAKLPPNRYDWSAFWLRNTAKVYPDVYDEIDIMEQFPPVLQWTNWLNSSAKGMNVHGVSTIANTATSFLWYVCDWEPGTIKWYVCTPSGLSEKFRYSGPCVPCSPCSLRLNLALQPSITAGALPQCLIIDEVDVYQAK